MSMKVRDVMSSPAVTVGSATEFKAIVELLRSHRISAAPVVDARGTVLGVVSEADLVLKEDRGEIEGQRHFFENRRTRSDRRKAAASTATELMTSPAVTIAADAPVAQAARLMRQHGVKRLPVLDDEGRLAGIVSRGDLLTVFTRRDEDIRAEIVDGVIARTLLVDPSPYIVCVRDGVVTLSGEADRRTDAILVKRLAERVDGVVGVRSALTYREDDGYLPASERQATSFFPTWL
jgi:CBS domain-containing protein